LDPKEELGDNVGEKQPTPEDRLIIFEACVSLFGLAIYGGFHHKAVGLRKVTWFVPKSWHLSEADYYASAAMPGASSGEKNFQKSSPIGIC
jgi:hypothetical protein